MVSKVQAWRAKDGALFESELDAARHDLVLLLDNLFIKYEKEHVKEVSDIILANDEHVLEALRRCVAAKPQSERAVSDQR